MYQKRKIIFKQHNNWVGEFEPEGGWQAGRRGIRRALCKIAQLEHLSAERRAIELTRLYNIRRRETLNKAESERKKKQKQVTLKKNMTVTQAKQLWSEEIAIHLSKVTIRDYRKSVDLYLDAVGNHTLREFSKQHSNCFIRHLQSLYTNTTTQNRHVRHFRVFINWAIDEEIIVKRIKIKSPPVKKKDMETFSLAHLAKLKNSLTTNLDEAESPSEERVYKNLLRAYTLATATLLRIGAIWSLKLENIDMDERIIRIKDNPELKWQNKQHKNPNKPISDKLYDFLSEDLTTRSPNERYFLDRGCGFSWLRDCGNVSRYMSRYCQKIGLPALKPFHWGMRATLITSLLNKGVPPHEVQQLADHSNIKTTMLYYNSRTANQYKTVNKLQGIINF